MSSKQQHPQQPIPFHHQSFSFTSSHFEEEGKQEFKPSIKNLLSSSPQTNTTELMSSLLGGGTSIMATLKQEEDIDMEECQNEGQRGLMSPPTPAPSPTPGRGGWWGTVAMNGEGGEGEDNCEVMFDGPSGGRYDPQGILLAFPSLPPPTRLALLRSLLPLLTTPELVMLSSHIGPRLKRDFLKELPQELALHCLKFIEDPQTLARATCVSRHWRRLLEDEQTWKEMCDRHRFRTPNSIHSKPNINRLMTPSTSDSSNLSDTIPQIEGVAVIRPSIRLGPDGQPITENYEDLTLSSASGTNDLAPVFGITGPEEFLPSRVMRDSGLLEEDATITTEQETNNYPHVALPTLIGNGNGADGNGGQNVVIGQLDGFGTQFVAAPQIMGHQLFGASLPPPPTILAAPSSQSSSNLTYSQYQNQNHLLNPLNSVSSTSNHHPSYNPPISSVLASSTTAPNMTGQINGQQPPMPSVVSPRASALSSVHNRTRQASILNQHQHGRSTSVPEPVRMGKIRKGTNGGRNGNGLVGGTVKEGVNGSGIGKDQGFSYKTHFKKSYLTESNWLRSGKLLSSHTSSDDGVVTALSLDHQHIIIGMANSKIHVFAAGNGSFLRTLVGHELGVWAMILVSAGSGVSSGSGSGSGDYGRNDMGMEDYEFSGSSEDEFESPPSSSSAYAQFNIGSYDGKTGTSRNVRALRKRNRSVRRSSFDNANVEGNQIPGGTSYAGNRSGQGSTDRLPSLASILGSGTGTGGDAYTKGGTRSSRSNNKFKRKPQSDVCGASRGWGQKFPIAVSGGCDRDIRVWNLETGECMHTIAGHTSTIRCIKMIDGRPIAVSGSRDSTLKVWDVEKGVMLHSLVGHQHSVRCIEIAGNQVVSGSYDCTCKVWDIDTGECLQTLRGHYHQIYAVAFDGERVATGSLDSTVRIWSAATGQCVALLQGHTSLVGQLQLTGDTLVTGGSDGRIIIFDLVNYACLQRICAHDNSVTCLQFDDRFIVSGGNDGRVKLWDIVTGNFIRELSKPCESVWKVTFLQDKCAILCKRGGKTILEVLSFAPEDI